MICLQVACENHSERKKRETGNEERKTTRFPLTVPRSTQNAAFLGGILLRPVFFLVTVPAQLFLALMLVHLFLALFTSPRHEWNSFR